MKDETKIYEATKTMLRKEETILQRETNRMLQMPIQNQMLTKNKWEVQ